VRFKDESAFRKLPLLQIPDGARKVLDAAREPVAGMEHVCSFPKRDAYTYQASDSDGGSIAIDCVSKDGEKERLATFHPDSEYAIAEDSGTFHLFRRRKGTTRDKAMGTIATINDRNKKLWGDRRGTTFGLPDNAA
jgi:hypothetical protein